MNHNSRNEVSQERGTGRLLASRWKRVVLAALVLIMVIGSAGCALEDLTSGFGGDVPFDQEQTKSSEIGALEDTPTVPDDAVFGDFDSRPLPPMN